MKKVVSILAVLGILMSSVNLPAVNAASGETAFNDTFAENVGDWEIGYAASSEGEYTGIAIIQEDGMLKFTSPIAKDVNGACRRPNVIRKINGGDGIAIPQDGTRLIINSRVMIPTNGRLAFKINLPDTPVSWNAARGAHILWNVGGDGFQRMNGCTQSTTSPTNHTWRLNEHLENAVLENKPMDVTVEMYKQSGTFRADYSVAVAGNTYTYTSADLTQFTQAGEDYSTLKNIAFIAEQTTDAMDYYIDNVSVYKKSNLDASIENNVILGNVGTVTLKCSATPDAGSILSVADESNNAVNVKTTVDAAAKTVSATFAELPAAVGNYTLKADKVTVLNGMSLNTSEYSFTVGDAESYVNENFSDGLGKFKLGMARYYDSDSASYINYTDSKVENSNGMLKFSAKCQGSDNAHTRVPNVIREINNGYGIDVPTNGGRLVIKTTLVMPEVDGVNLAVKTNVGEDTRGWENGLYLFDLFRINSGSGFLVRNGVNENNLSANVGIGLGYGEFAGKRMEVTTEIYFDNATPKADYSISIDGGRTVVANGRDLTEMSGVNDYTKIKNIGFFVSTSSAEADYYIDDIKIYNKSTILADLANDIIFEDESADLKLNITPDEGAVLAIKDEQGENVEVTETIYNEETKTLSAVPAENLSAGKYTLDASGVTVNEGMSLEKTEYAFTVIKEEKIINEQFDKDNSSWVIADNAQYYDSDTESYLPYEGTTLTNSNGKMVFHAPDAKTANALGRRPYIIRTFNNGRGIKIPTNGQRLIIKTGITLPEDGNGICFTMDTNVPEEIKGWETGTYYYDLFRITPTYGLMARQGYDENRISRNGDIGASYDMFAGTQAEIKIEIYHADGKPKADYQIIGNGKTITANGCDLSQHPQVGEDYTYLKNIAFTSEGVAADYSIDYIQIYHESGDNNIAFVDANGENIKTLDNGNVYADINYVLNGDETKVLAAIALYEEVDGVIVLKDIDVIEKELKDHELFYDSSLNVTVTDKNAQFVKVFLWDKAALKPVETTKAMGN